MTTQLDFDTPPLYDGILNVHNLYFSDIWIGYWSNFIQTLISYLTQNGLMLPNLTQAEINSLQIATLVNGQLLYNIDPLVDAPQFWQTSTQSWRTITFT